MKESGIIKFFRKIRETIGLKRTMRVPPSDIKAFADRIIADGIIINELPSPTDAEEVRGEFVRRRLDEFGYEDVQTDDVGNIFVFIPGDTTDDRYLLVYSDMDNARYSYSESIVEIKENRLVGLGIGDNSLGASALLVLCEYLRRHELHLAFNLIVLFSLHNTPEDDFHGINFFLGAWHDRIWSSIYLFGLHFGNLLLDSYGIYNLSFLLRSSNTDALGRNYIDSSVDFAVQLYNEIGKTDWEKSGTVVNIVRIAAGIGFEYFPTEGEMDIEVFSKDAHALEETKVKIIGIAEQVAKNKSFTIENNTKSHIPPALTQRNEKLTAILKGVYQKLGIAPKISQIPDQSSIVNKFDVPSITLGITTGEYSLNDEYVDIKNIQNGFRQVLLFIDELSRLQEGVTR